MANYTILPNAAVNTGGLPSGTTVTALRDNPIAITEGALNAPRIVGGAIKRLANMPVLTVSASDALNCETLTNVTAGTLSTTGTSFVVARAWAIILGTGTIRVRFDHIAGTATSPESTAKVTKNGIDQASFTTGTGVASRVVDVSVAPGDTVQLEHRRSGSTGTVSVSNIQLSASDAYVPRLPYVADSQKNVI